MASQNTLGSSRPPLPAIKKSILNFIQGLVPYSLYRAFQILLSPCCDITITDVDIVCDPSAPAGDSIYDITLTLSESVSLAGMGYASVFIGSTPQVHPTIQPIDSTNVVTFNHVNLTSIGGAGTYPITLSFYLAPYGITLGSPTVVFVSQTTGVFPGCK